jgi:hypothetical protein
MIRFSQTPLDGDPEPISDVKNMIKDYASRIAASGANPANEFIAVKLNGIDISTLIKDYGAKDLVAFFGVENNSQTVVLMGLDSNSKLIKDLHNNYVAIERWGKFGMTVDKVIANPLELDKVFP